MRKPASTTASTSEPPRGSDPRDSAVPVATAALAPSGRHAGWHPGDEERGGTIDDTVALHASALVVGEDGLLIRGASGSGKTRLALALVDDARRAGRFARLVADDLTLVARHGDRLVARPHPKLAGLAERRGLGIVAVDHEPACVIRRVVDIVAGWPDRMPAPEALHGMLARVVLPRLPVAAEASTQDMVALISAWCATIVRAA